MCLSASASELIYHSELVEVKAVLFVLKVANTRPAGISIAQMNPLARQLKKIPLCFSILMLVF